MKVQTTSLLLQKDCDLRLRSPFSYPESWKQKSSIRKFPIPDDGQVSEKFVCCNGVMPIQRVEVSLVLCGRFC